MDLLKTFKFAPRILFHRGMPLQLVFFITSNCNLRCSHCFYTSKLNRNTDLSLPEIERISKHMGRLLWLSITGGEPFLRKDISEIIQLFYRNNGARLMTIITNGTVQMEDQVSDICSKCPQAEIIIYVSIDGKEEMHNKIRGGDIFGKTKDTLFKLKELKRHCRNLKVATVTTCMPENQDEMESTALFIKNELQPDQMTVNLMRDKPARINVENYLKFAEVQKKSPFVNRIIRNKEIIQKQILATVYEEDRFVIPCLAGNISCVIDSDGTVFPCEMLKKDMGNLRDLSFQEIWFSERAEDVRKYIKKTHCFCTYECALTTNILFNPGYLWKILK